MGSVMANFEPPSGDPVIPKPESLQDDYSRSTPSTPEVDIEPSTQGVVQAQKRKGGRKPIYATSEERKQRNRQAQAAFRERRTEYIKQLETTIKHHEDNLQTLQQNHRSAADECLMLRYKNSLLERILLEKGIDVQAELRIKGSPHLGPSRPRPSVATQASRGNMINTHQAARSNSMSGMPPLQPAATPVPGPHHNAHSHPPTQRHKIPQSPSPSTTRPSAFSMQSGLPSPTSAFPAQQIHQKHRPQNGPHRNSFTQQSSTHHPAPGALATSHGPIPEHEFDTPTEMSDSNQMSAAPGQVISNFRPPDVSMNINGQEPQSAVTNAGGASYRAPVNHAFDTYDPMLDADPFGLSASMHFPTPFTYDSRQPGR